MNARHILIFSCATLLALSLVVPPANPRGSRHIGLIGGIRGRVAEMLIQAVKERGRVTVLAQMTVALALAERLAKEDDTP